MQNKPRKSAPSESLAFVRRLCASDHGALAKHEVLRHALAAAISQKIWKPGVKLPTETELARATPYSLGTVQRALRALVEDGYIQRRRGYGTYVPDRRRQLNDPWHCRFLSDDGESFLPVFTVPLHRSVMRRHGRWSAPLKQGQEEVVQIDRRMEINDEFVVYSKFYVLAAKMPAFRDAPLEGLSGANLKLLIAREIGRPLTALKQRLCQAVIPDAICKLVGVKRHTVGLLLEATAYAGVDTPAYYQELYIPPTERHLYLESRVPG